MSVKWNPARGWKEACPSHDGKAPTAESLFAKSPSGVFRFGGGEAGRAEAGVRKKISTPRKKQRQGKTNRKGRRSLNRLRRARGSPDVDECDTCHRETGRDYPGTVARGAHCPPPTSNMTRRRRGMKRKSRTRSCHRASLNRMRTRAGRGSTCSAAGEAESTRRAV